MGRSPNGTILSDGISVDSMLSRGIVDWDSDFLPLEKTMEV